MSLTNEQIGSKLSAVATAMRSNQFTDALKGVDEVLSEAKSNENVTKFLSATYGMQAECFFALGRAEYVVISPSVHENGL